MTLTAKTRTTDELIAAGAVDDLSSPFALPRGLKGRLAGWYMGFSDPQHRELAARVPIGTARVLVEIGFGPGQLLAALHRQAPSVHLAGVDPSELMLRKAQRRSPAGDLHLGAASDT